MKFINERLFGKNHKKSYLQFSNSCRVMEQETICENWGSRKIHKIRIFFLESEGVVSTIFFYVIFFSISIFNSCETDSDKSKKYNSCDDIKSESSVFTTLRVNITDNRIQNSYNSVKVEVYYRNYYTVSGGFNPNDYIYDIVDGTERVDKTFHVVEAEGKNPTLKFKDVPDEYLINILKRTDLYSGLNDLFCGLSYLETSIKISNENAKVAFGSVFAGGKHSIGTDDGIYNTDYIRVDMSTTNTTNIALPAFDNLAWGRGILVYCNTECNISGDLGFIRYPSGEYVNQGIIDIRLKKGWNQIFHLYSDDCNEKLITIRTDDVHFSITAG